MRNEQGTIVYEKQKIVTIIHNLYKKLYEQEMLDAGTTEIAEHKF